MHSVVRMSHEDIVELKSILAEGKTITAVKYCREHGRHFIDGVEQHAPGLSRKRMSLKAAKHAVDVFRGHPPMGTPEAVIVPALEIKSIRVATLEGEFEVDLDGLQLKLLNGLDSLPLSVLAHSTELIKYLRDWQDCVRSGE